MVVLKHIKDRLTAIPYLLLATLLDVLQGVNLPSPWGATGMAWFQTIGLATIPPSPV